MQNSTSCHDLVSKDSYLETQYFLPWKISMAEKIFAVKKLEAKFVQPTKNQTLTIFKEILEIFMIFSANNIPKDILIAILSKEMDKQANDLKLIIESLAISSTFRKVSSTNSTSDNNGTNEIRNKTVHISNSALVKVEPVKNDSLNEIFDTFIKRVMSTSMNETVNNNNKERVNISMKKTDNNCLNETENTFINKTVDDKFMNGTYNTSINKTVLINFMNETVKTTINPMINNSMHQSMKYEKIESKVLRNTSIVISRNKSSSINVTIANAKLQTQLLENETIKKQKAFLVKENIFLQMMIRLFDIAWRILKISDNFQKILSEALQHSNSLQQEVLKNHNIPVPRLNETLMEVLKNLTQDFSKSNQTLNTTDFKMKHNGNRLEILMFEEISKTSDNVFVFIDCLILI